MESINNVKTHVNFIIIVLTCVLLSSCSINNDNINDVDVITGKYKLTQKEEYLYKTSITAKELGKKYNLYPSVIIAQSILESNWGESILSSEHNNYFGIKGDFNGHSVSFETTEIVNGKEIVIIDSFRSYENKYQSFEDYCKLIRQDWYEGVWKENTNSYLDATKNLQGVYATDTNYAEKLNQIIIQYDLNKFDF